MPTLIPRDEALERIRREVGDTPCLMCAMRDGRVGERWVVDEDDELLLIVPRYVRRWGQLLVVLKPHVTRYSDVEPRLWARANAWALAAARIVERERDPIRCYITSTGSAAGELTQSSAHVHIHVVPVYDSDDRPRHVFSWAQGVYVGTTEEWRELTEAYRAAWSKEGEPGGSAHHDRRPAAPDRGV